jgi:ribonuclease P protein component
VAADFPPDSRLHSRREYTVVQEHGRRVSAKSLTLLGWPNGLRRDRLGIIASRKLGGAVVRNRAKRRLREIFRHETSRQSAEPQFETLDLVAIPRRELVIMPFVAVRAEFERALRKIRGQR